VAGPELDQANDDHKGPEAEHEELEEPLNLHLHQYLIV
jgi:hypothetical protein